MQRGFTKLFNTIVTSTIWSEDDKTRIIWITMLAIADSDGIVSASIPGLAKVANVSVEDTEKAIKNLKAPDPYSRTTEFEGRRIEDVDGGWMVLNYVKYRRMLSEEERREYKAKWIQNKRRQMSTESTAVDGGRRKSTNVSASSSASEWIEGLQREEAYRHVNVKHEFEKMKNWCALKKKQPTRARLINWLNRVDLPLNLKTTGGRVAAPNGLKPDRPVREPTDSEIEAQREIIRKSKESLNL